MFARVKKALSVLHKDEQGADMVEYILVIAAVGLPLLAVIIWFWGEISSNAREWWDAIKGNATPSGTLEPS